MIKMRLLDTDENYSLRGTILEAAVQDDRNLGLIPFFVILIENKFYIFGVFKFYFT